MKSTFGRPQATTRSPRFITGTNRLMPVVMAASTTALGMLPLIFDAFFVSMAVTIIFGLMCATVLTMIVLPVIYAILYKLPYRRE
jgi:multidrug efflux pump subunit AcrB